MIGKAPICRAQRARNRGFSLVELIVVLMLIAIMMAMILPEMRGTFGDALLRATARKLVDVVNLASSRAITLNQVHRVWLDRKHTHYHVEGTTRQEEGRNA